MSVVIGGGSGFVGRHLTKMLIERGFKVTVVSRTSKPNQMTWKDVENNGLPEGCTAVVNVAGENILNPFKRYSNKSFRDEIWKSRIDTTLCLAKAIRNAEKAPEVFVTMSGVGFYPPSKTAVYTESSPGGDDWLAELSHDWEVAGNLPQTLPTRRVVVRSGVILGKDGGFIKEVEPFFKKMFGARLSTGKQYFPWIHVKDIAGIFTFAIQENNVSGILNGVAPEVSTNSSFTQTYAAAWKRPIFGVLPDFYMKFVFGPERAKVVLEGQCVLPKRIQRFGYNFYYPTLKTACAELVS